MGDLPERLRRLYVQHGTNYVQEAADEIERLRQWELVGREWIDKTDWMQSNDAPARWLGRHRADCLREEVERLTAERDDLRAALVATMEIVQEDRAGFALANTWPDGSMEAGDDAILRRYDAVIAQADAALGVER